MTERADATEQRQWGEGAEGDQDVIAYINEHHLLMSLLYDLDLLPEQHPEHDSAEWEKIFAITNHWREQELARSEIVATPSEDMVAIARALVEDNDPIGQNEVFMLAREILRLKSVAPSAGISQGGEADNANAAIVGQVGSQGPAPSTASRCVVVPEELANAIREVCYQPGGYKEIAHINYCRWCSYAEGHPHGDKCPMRLLAER